MQRYNEAKRNVPSDHEILAAVNERARQLVLSEMPPDELERLKKQSETHPQFGTIFVTDEGFRCDMSRVGFIRRRWERAAKEYLEETGLDVLDSLRRIEAELRNPTNAPVLHA